MSDTNWTPWEEYGDYNYLDRKGKYQHALGSLPTNTPVKFDDGDIGRVVHSNSDKSLVHYGNTRDWFPNSVLRVPAS